MDGSKISISDCDSDVRGRVARSKHTDNDGGHTVFMCIIVIYYDYLAL
jgi:hypothetical protein